MATARDLEGYRGSQRDVVALAHADLVGFLDTVDVTDAAAASAAMQDFLPTLVADYGSVAAAVAADTYDELRDRAGVARPYRATVAESASVEQAAAVARWGVGPLFAVDPDTMRALALLGGGVQRLVQQAGRDTILANVDSDPADVRWARSPQGATCAFCLMCASRGAVYSSEAAAGGMTDWHSDCDCQPEPVFADEPLSYDADALYEQYAAAARKAGTTKTRAVTAQLRDDLSIS